MNFRRTKAAKIEQLEENVTKLNDQMRARKLETAGLRNTVGCLLLEVRFPTEALAREEGYLLLKHIIKGVSHPSIRDRMGKSWKKFQAHSDYMKRKGWEVPSVNQPEPPANIFVPDSVRERMEVRKRFVYEVARIADEMDEKAPRSGVHSRKFRQYVRELQDALAKNRVR